MIRPGISLAEEEMDDTLDMHAGDQSFGDDHLASSGGQPNSAPAVAAPIQTQQPLPELSKWEKESGDELGDDSDTEEKVNGDDRSGLLPNFFKGFFCEKS